MSWRCQCGKSHSYRTKFDAQLTLNMLPRRKERKENRVYRCRFGVFHLTSKPYNPALAPQREQA